MSLLFFVTNSACWAFAADVGIAYILERLHQIQLLCDHQELAYTPKDPPWRVSMTVVSFRHIDGSIYSVIDKTVWRPTLVTPILVAGIFRPLHTTSNHFRPLQTTSDHFRPLQTASNHFNQPLQTTSGPKCSVHQPLQATSTHFKRDVGGNKGFHHYLYNLQVTTCIRCMISNLNKSHQGWDRPKKQPTFRKPKHFI